jgi:hypothetical protein
MSFRCHQSARKIDRRFVEFAAYLFQHGGGCCALNLAVPHTKEPRPTANHLLTSRREG